MCFKNPGSVVSAAFLTPTSKASTLGRADVGRAVEKGLPYLHGTDIPAQSAEQDRS